MDLRKVERCFKPQCFAGRYVGKHIVLWPQEPEAEPQFMGADKHGNKTGADGYTLGSWLVYQNVHEPVYYTVSGSQRTLRSARRTQEFCKPHWDQLMDNWIRIAWEEVALDYIFYQYVERTER